MTQSVRRGLAYAAAGFGGCVMVGSVGTAAAQQLRELRQQETGAAAAPTIIMREKEMLQNYSETHRVEAVVHRPEDEAALLALLGGAAQEGRKLRVVGSGLSPNGVALPKDGAEAVSLANMDSVLHFDKDAMEITVEAGCTVRAVQEYLSDRGLTLENFCSISDQEVAGWTQVAAHGTGATLPTVEEQITKLRLAAPNGAVYSLTSESPLFGLAKASLGTLGVLTQVTLRCKAQHKLKETSVVEPLETVFAKHLDRLRDHLHVKYLLVPGHEEAMVVTADPTDAPLHAAPAAEPAHKELWERLKSPGDADPVDAVQYREALLDRRPLEYENVKEVNAADLESWRAAQGTRVGASSDVLGFNCGGHQWVYEVAFPVGTLERTNGNDVAYMKNVLETVQKHKIAAPAPIEVRFCGASTSPLSAAYSTNLKDVFCWIGIIMYLPPHDPARRREITAAFEQYKTLTEPLQAAASATPHWAKVELHDTAALKALGVKHRDGLAALRAARRETDPYNVLSSPLLEEIYKLMEA